MRAALHQALVFACVLQVALAQTVPVPAQGIQKEADSFARPQGAKEKIDIRDQQALIRRLGQLVPHARHSAIEAALAGAPRLSPPALYALANALAQDYEKVPEAVFWYHVGRIRAHYDAQRSKDPAVREVIVKLGQGLNPDVSRYQRQHRQETLKIAERAIKWDVKNSRTYDHRWINVYGEEARTSAGTVPAELTLPESEWPAILQRVHADHLKSVQDFADGKKGK